MDAIWCTTRPRGHQEEWLLLQRAVFVIDDEGTGVHAEYVADQVTEPGYDAAIGGQSIGQTNEVLLAPSEPSVVGHTKAM